MNRAQGVSNLPYTPYTGELVAPVNPQQYAGIGNINQYAFSAQPTLGVAQNMAWNAAQPISYADIARYQNPWMQNVVGATEAQFNNQNVQQLQNVRGNAIAQGALGGDREAVAEAELANQQNLAQAPVIANLESQGYTQGVNTALTEQQALASGAYSLGNLGVAGQNAGLTGANAQITAGNLEFQRQQALDAALQQQFQTAQAFPYQQTQWLAGIDTGVGSQMGGTSATQAPTPSPWSQAAGLGLGGLGIMGQTGAFGASGWLGPFASSVGSGLSSLGGSAAALLPLAAVQRGGRINGVAGYDDGGGVSPLPYASPGRAWEPYAGGHGWVPHADPTHGRGPPAPPRPPQQDDPMKLGEQVAGLAQYFKDGKTPTGFPSGRTSPGWLTSDSPITSGYSGVPTGVAPVSMPTPPGTGWAGAGSPLMAGYRRDGGGVLGYADGGMPELPDDLSGLVSQTEPARGAIESVARAATPGLYDYFTADRPPPSLPARNYVGKVQPSNYDPYFEPALRDVRNIGLMATPFGAGEGVGLRALEGGLGAGEASPAIGMRGLGDVGTTGVAMMGAMQPTSAMAGDMGERSRIALERALGPRPELPNVEGALGQRPKMADDEQAASDKLSAQIKAIETQRDAAIDKINVAQRRAMVAADPGPKAQAAAIAPFERDKEAARQAASGRISPLSAQMATISGQVNSRQNDYDERAKTLHSDAQKRQSDWDDKAIEFARQNAPFAMRHPGITAAGRTAPLASAYGGNLLARWLTRAGVSPAKVYAATVGSGAIEGAIGAYGPTYMDLGMPEGTEAREAADRANRDPAFWAGTVLPEVGFSALTGAAGAKYGIAYKAKQAAEEAARGVAGPATVPTLPSPPSQARSWPTNADGSRKWPSGPTDPLMKNINVRPKKGGGYYDANTGHTLPANLWPRQPSGKIVPIQAAEAHGGAVRGYWGGGSPFADAPTDDLYGGVAPQYVSDPASIRTNNPGAQWMGPVARQFGATTSQGLSGGNNAAVFPDSESGAAAQFALWGHNYTGMPLSSAINKWSGGNSPREYTNFIARSMGISPDTVLTPQILAGPQGIALAKAQAQWEAGRPYPMTDAQWTEAQARGMQGVSPTQAAYRTRGVAGGYGDLVPLSSASAGQPTGVAPQSGIDLSSNSKLWPSLMAAGFGMMASRSPYPLQAIGEGALTGMGAYTKASELESERAMKQSDINLRAEKLWDQNEIERKKLAQAATKFEWSTLQPVTIQTPLGQRSVQKLPDGTYRDIQSGQVYGGEQAKIAPAEEQPQLQPVQFGEPRNRLHAVDTHPEVLDMVAKEDPGMAATIKAIDEGRQSLSSVGLRDRTIVGKYLNMYDPNWNQQVFAQRQRLMNDLTTNGNAGKMILAVNQLWPHLEKASKQAEALDNTDYPAANTIKNWWLTQTGDPRIKQFDTVREVAAMDAARLLRGSGAMAEKDVEFWRQTLASAGSPRQMQNVLADLADDLMRARVGSIEQGYRTIMGKEPPDFISLEAKSALTNVIKMREITNARDRLDRGDSRESVEAGLRDSGIDPARLGANYAQNKPAAQPTGRPANVPAGSLRSPSTGKWKGPDGTIYNPDGSVSTPGKVGP